MQVITKVRYKVFSKPQVNGFNPFADSSGHVKDKGIVQYVKYVKKGAKEAQDQLDLADQERELDLEPVFLRSNGDSVPEGATPEEAVDLTSRYASYMENRQGSTGFFTNNHQDPEQLILELEQMEKDQVGGVFMPIVSMKASDAILAGCTTEQQWQENLLEFSYRFAEIARIPRESLQVLGAFHLKPKAMQKLDAGEQPHGHLMIWDGDHNVKELNLTKSQIEKIREIADDIFCGSYYREKYQERNELRQTISDNFLPNSLMYMKDKINTLVSDIAIVTNQHGKLTQKTLKKNQQMLIGIKTKEDSFIELTDGEKALKKKLKINSAQKLETKISLYNSINKDLDVIVHEMLDTPELKPLMDRWIEVSKDIKSGKGEKQAQVSLAADREALENVLKNRILMHAKEAVPQSEGKIRIPSEKMQAKLLYKVDKAKFKKSASKERVDQTLQVMANLIHTYRIPEGVCQAKLEALLFRSGVPMSPQQLQEMVKKEYEEPAVLNSTSYEVNAALRTLSYDSHPEGEIFSLNPYADYQWKSLEMATLGYFCESLADLTLDRIMENSQDWQQEYDDLLERISLDRNDFLDVNPLHQENDTEIELAKIVDDANQR